jgi:hypothetical protein
MLTVACCVVVAAIMSARTETAVYTHMYLCTWPAHCQVYLCQAGPSQHGIFYRGLCVTRDQRQTQITAACLGSSWHAVSTSWHPLSTTWVLGQAGGGGRRHATNTFGMCFCIKTTKKIFAVSSESVCTASLCCQGQRSLVTSGRNSAAVVCAW